MEGLRRVDTNRTPGWFARAYATLSATGAARFVSRHLNWKLDLFLLRVTRGIPIVQLTPARLAGVIDTVETVRLVLRPLRADDVDELVALDADPEVMRLITGGRPSTREQVGARVRAALGYRWMAYAREDGGFVGWFSLEPTDGDPRSRQLGYRLRRECWGRGLATEGSRALVDAAFEHLDVERIWAQTMTVNVASRRVMEHCGMRFVRTFHGSWPDVIEGAEQGDVEYELRRPI